MSEAAGWYPDPFFGGRERYWDGGEWTEQCRAADTKEHQASAKPRAPLNPERATPSAVLAKFERRAAGGGLATMVRPEARETTTASPTMTPPTTAAAAPAAAVSSPEAPPQTATETPDNEGQWPTTSAWPTDTGWTIGAAAVTAVGTTDTPRKAPSTPTEEILRHAPEEPGAADAAPTAEPEEPEEPTMTEEVLAETDVTPESESIEALEETEEPTLTEEVLDEAPPTFDVQEAPVPTVEAPSLIEEELDGTEAPAVAATALVEPDEDVDDQSAEREPEPAAHVETEDDDVDGPPADSDAPPKAPRPRRRRRVLIGAIAIVVLAIIVVAAASLSKGGGGTSATQQVADAASATINDQYAQVNVSTNVPKGQDAAAGVVTGFSANGNLDFATSQGSLSLTSPANGGTEALVIDGSTMYLEPGTIVAQLVHGKPWVSVTATDLGSEAPSGFALAPTLLVQLVGGPTTMLAQLQADGVTAHKTGSLIYEGTPVDEYAVSLSPDAIALREKGVPSSLQGTVVTGQQETVYVSNGLVRAITVPFDVHNNGTTAMGTLTVGYTSWGDSTDISTPAPDQVASWDQLRDALTYATGLG